MSEHETVFAACMATAAAAPDNAFLCVPPAPGRSYHPNGVELTYAETRERVLECQARYADHQGALAEAVKVGCKLGSHRSVAR